MCICILSMSKILCQSISLIQITHGLKICFCIYHWIILRLWIAFLNSQKWQCFSHWRITLIKTDVNSSGKSILQPRLMMNGADFRFIIIRKILTKEVPSDRIWIVPGIVSFIQDVVSNSDWSSCTKSDEPWWYFLFVHNLLWNRTHSKFRSLSLFKSLTLTFLSVPKIPNFIKKNRKRQKLKEDHVKVLLKRFHLSGHTVALHGPGLRSFQM